MNILITGGGGFLGFRLAKTLLARGKLGGKPVSRVTLLDGAFPSGVEKLQKVTAVTGDVSDGKTIARVCTPGTGAGFPLAGGVRGGAAGRFGLGQRVNVEGRGMSR